MMGFLNVNVFAVFLLPLPQGEREGLQCDLGIWVVRGSLKLTIFIFAVFLKPLGVGREMGSMCTQATRLGTLNWSIPNCSEVAYERRICGLVASLKTWKHIGYDLAWETCLTFVMNWPRMGCGVQTWEIQEWLVGLRDVSLGKPFPAIF